MGTAKLKTAARREQIAQAALDLIAQRGIGGLSVAEIAERIGLVPSALYRHFRGKDEVIDAVMELIHARLITNVHAATAKSSRPVEQLRLLLDRHAQLIQRNQGIPRLIFSEEGFGGQERRRSRFYAIVRDYLKHVSEILRRGQAAGEVRADLDPAAGSLLFLGLLQPAALLWHLSGGQFNINRHLDHVWGSFVSAIEP